MFSWLLLSSALGAGPIGPFGYEPVNPFARSRSPLAMLAAPDGDVAQVAVTFDLANSVEATWLRPEVRLDAELYLWRVEAWVPVLPNFWLYARVAAGSAGPGVFDPAIDAWHSFLFDGTRVFPQRLYAGTNLFLDEFDLEGTHRRGTPGFFLGETRVGWAMRPLPWALVALTLSVPTTTRPGRGLEAPGIGTWVRATWTPWRWLRVEGSGGLGASATQGPLAPWQATFFAAAALDVAVLPGNDHAFFAQLWLHSPYYVRTGTLALDDPDLSLRVGYRARVAGLFELELGVTEDLSDGSALDVGFHVAVRR